MDNFELAYGRVAIGSVKAFAIAAETAADIPAREALLDRAMGTGRKRKSSEKLRRGCKPSEGLAFVARAVIARRMTTRETQAATMALKPLLTLYHDRERYR